MNLEALYDRWEQEAEALYQLKELRIREESLDRRITEMEQSLAYMKHTDQQAEENPFSDVPGDYVINEEGELVFVPA